LPYAALADAGAIFTDGGNTVSGRMAFHSPAVSAKFAALIQGTYVDGNNKKALEMAKVGRYAGFDNYETVFAPTHTVGTLGGTPLVNGGAQAVTYATAKDTWSQSLITDGWTAAAANRLKAGDVFTIANVYCVNPVSKEVLPDLQQFVVKADADSGASTGPSALTISPAIILTGAYQNVNAAPADDALITVVGTGGAIYPQNMIFRKEAFALCVKPLEKPAGAVNPEVMTDDKTGLSLRLIPVYDGINNVSNWRLDILFGVKAIYPELATRLSGTS